MRMSRKRKNSAMFGSAADNELAKAVIGDNARKVRRAIGNGADVNAVSIDKDSTILLLVVRKTKSTDLTVLKTLLEAGADPNLVLPGVPSPLSRAAQHTTPDVLNILLRHGADPNVVEEGGNPAVFAAAVSRRWHNILELLPHINLDAQGVNGQTLLILLTRLSSWSHAQEILKMGADFTIETEQGETVETIMEKYNVSEKDYDYKGYRSLFEAVQERKKDAFGAVDDGGASEAGDAGVFPYAPFRLDTEEVSMTVETFKNEGEDSVSMKEYVISLDEPDGTVVKEFGEAGQGMESWKKNDASHGEPNILPALRRRQNETLEDAPKEHTAANIVQHLPVPHSSLDNGHTRERDALTWSFGRMAQGLLM